MTNIPFRLKMLVGLCWAFFALCAIVIGRWAILKFVCWAGWGNPDWAAWCQAVGSIIAIVATVGAVMLGERMRKRANQRNRLVHALSTIRFFQEVINELGEVSSIQAISGHILDYHRKKFEIAARKVESIPLDDLSLPAIESLSTIERRACTLYALLASAPPEEQQGQHYFSKAIAEISPGVDIARAVLKAELETL